MTVAARRLVLRDSGAVSNAELALAAGVGPRAARFRAVVEGAVGRLPFGLDEVIAPTLVGFVVINGATFGLDLGLVTLLHSMLGLVLAAAFTLAYVIAFATSFALNRWLNFRSRAPVGRQLAVYAVAVAINYLAFILGLATALSAVGVEYHLSRIAAGICEAVYMYIVLRWVVFRVRA